MSAYSITTYRSVLDGDPTLQMHWLTYQRADMIAESQLVIHTRRGSCHVHVGYIAIPMPRATAARAIRSIRQLSRYENIT